MLTDKSTCSLEHGLRSIDRLDEGGRGTGGRAQQENQLLRYQAGRGAYSHPTVDTMSFCMYAYMDDMLGRPLGWGRRKDDAEGEAAGTCMCTVLPLFLTDLIITVLKSQMFRSNRVRS